MTTLGISHTTVAKIIRLFQASTSNKSVTVSSVGATKVHEDFLKTLSPQNLQELIALVWLGRGDYAEYGDAEFTKALEEAKQYSGGDADYLDGLPLEDYLPLALGRLQAFPVTLPP